MSVFSRENTSLMMSFIDLWPYLRQQTEKKTRLYFPCRHLLSARLQKGWLWRNKHPNCSEWTQWKWDCSLDTTQANGGCVWL